MERAGRDEQDVVGLDRSVLGRDRGALDERQEVALHALAGHARAHTAPFRADSDLVDLVQKHDAVILHRVQGFGHDLLVVEQLVGLVVHQKIVGLLDGDATFAGRLLAELAHDVGQVDHSHLPRHSGHLEAAPAAFRHFDLDLGVIEFAVAELLGVFGSGRGRGGGGHERVQHALLGGVPGAGCNILAPTLAHETDGDLHQIPHDLLHVTPNIADFGELGRFDLDERRPRKAGQTAGDLGFANTRGADHQDVLRADLFAHGRGKLLTTPAVAKRDGNRALGVLLADNEAIEFGNGFAGRERHECPCLPASGLLI